MEKIDIDKIIKLSIVASVLLIGFSLFYYLVIFLPQKEQNRINLQKQEQLIEENEKQAKIEQQKNKEVEEQKEKEEAEKEIEKNKLLLGNCLSNTYETYNGDWARACESQAEIISKGIKDCIGLLSENDCKRIWGEPDNSPDCSLPAEVADTLNERRQKNKDECFKIYPQK